MFSPNTSQRRQWNNLQESNIFSVFLLWSAFHEVWAKTPVPVDPSLENQLAEEEYWSEHRVEPRAQVISTPKLIHGQIVYREWLLKAKDGNSTIALSTIGGYLNLGRNDLLFSLEARDGDNNDSPLIARLQAIGEDRELMWTFSNPIKSTSGFLFLQFVNKGNDPPQFDFAYYECGGTVMPSTRIITPYFPEMNFQQPVDCKWTLKKSDERLYGCLSPVTMNVTHCQSLQMFSNDSMHVIERIDDSPSSIGSIEEEKGQTTKNFSNFVQTNTSRTVLPGDNTKLTRNFYVYQICGNLIQMIAFEENAVTLFYATSNPQPTPEFIGDFRVLRVPNFIGTNIRSSKWFYDYCSLMIFLPIGLIIGFTIIIYQGNYSKKGSSPLIVVTATADEGSMESKVVFNDPFSNAMTQVTGNSKDTSHPKSYNILGHRHDRNNGACAEGQTNLSIPRPEKYRQTLSLQKI